MVNFKKITNFTLYKSILILYFLNTSYCCYCKKDDKNKDNVSVNPSFNTSGSPKKSIILKLKSKGKKINYHQNESDSKDSFLSNQKKISNSEEQNVLLEMTPNQKVPFGNINRACEIKNKKQSKDDYSSDLKAKVKIGNDTSLSILPKTESATQSLHKEGENDTIINIEEKDNIINHENLPLVKQLNLKPVKQKSKNLIKKHIKRFSKNIGKNKLLITLGIMLKDKFHILKESTLKTCVDISNKLDIYMALIEVAKIGSIQSCKTLSTLIFFAFEIETERNIDSTESHDKEIKIIIDFKNKYQRFMQINHIRLGISNNRREAKSLILQSKQNLEASMKLVKEELESDKDVLDLNFGLDTVIDSLLKIYFLKCLFSKKENIQNYYRAKCSVESILSQSKMELLKKRKLENYTAIKLTFINKIISFLNSN